MMVFDFSFYLFLGTAITGLIWALDVWVLAPRRSKVFHANSEIHQGVEIKRGGKEPVIVEYSKSFFPVLLFVLATFMVSRIRFPKAVKRESTLINTFQVINIVLIIYCGVTRSWPEYLFGISVFLLVAGIIAGRISKPVVPAEQG